MLSRKESFFGLHFDLHPNEHDMALGADVTEEMLEYLLTRVKPDYVQYDCKGHRGYTGYPTKVGWASPGIQRDALAVWREVTCRHDVALFIHYSGVYDKVAVEHHPEWARGTPEGAPDPNGITSTFGPYVDELLIPQLKEVFGQYDLNGAWVDGECWATLPDYGEAALQAWREATGYEDAPRAPDEPHWHAWLEFNREQFERYLTHYLDALHAFNPALEITSNWMYTSFAPRPVKAPLDFISGDYSARDSVNTARLGARYIASIGMPWDLMAWGFTWRGNVPGQNRSHKPAVQLQQEASVVLAQGGGFQFYYQPTRAGWVDAYLVDLMAEVAAFCRARQEVSHKTESVPQVALLLSSVAFYDRTNNLFRAWEGELNALKGVLHALLEAGYSVDVLAEHQVAPNLDQYPVLVLPEVHTLAPEFRAKLVEYVERGGRLLAIGAETAKLFEAELGVEFVGEPETRNAYVWMGELMGAFGGVWQAVHPTTATVVGERFPTFDPRKDGEPAATVNDLGQGQIAAIYGPLGTVHLGYHTPQLREFLHGMLRIIFPQPLVEVLGPPCVDVTIRCKGHKLLIHLINTAGMSVESQYAIIDHVPAVGPLTLIVRLEAEPTAVSLVPGGSPLAWHWDEGVLTLTVPSLHIHEVVVIE